jgi:hypothetical protein
MNLLRIKLRFDNLINILLFCLSLNYFIIQTLLLTQFGKCIDLIVKKLYLFGFISSLYKTNDTLIIRLFLFLEKLNNLSQLIFSVFTNNKEIFSMFRYISNSWNHMKKRNSFLISFYTLPKQLLNFDSTLFVLFIKIVRICFW